MKKSLKQPSIFESMKKLQNRSTRKKFLMNSPVIVIDDDDFEPNGGRDFNRANLAKRKLNFNSSSNEEIGCKRKTHDKNKNVPIASSTPIKVSKKLSNETVSESTLHSSITTNKSLCSSSDSESTIILTEEHIEESIFAAQVMLDNSKDMDCTSKSEDNTLISSSKRKTKTIINNASGDRETFHEFLEVCKENRSGTACDKQKNKKNRGKKLSNASNTSFERTDSESSDDIFKLRPGITNSTTPKKQDTSIRNSKKGLMSPPLTPGKTLSLSNRSPSKSPSQRSPGKISPGSSPKKERGMNKAVLAVITKLFASVNDSVHVRCLLEEEQAILSDFLLADPKYKYTCLKLYTYKLKWYNSYKFCEKIRLGVSNEEINEMYNFLANKGIIETDYSNEDLSYLLNILHVPDLKQIAERFKLKRPAKGKNKSIAREDSIQLTGKEDIIQQLLRNSRTQSTLSFAKSTKDLLYEEIKNKLGLCFKLTDTFREAFYKIYLLGTYTNPQFANMSDFFHFVLDTNVAFPEFHVEDYEVFKTKEEFQSYAKAKKLSDDVENAMNEKRCCDMLQICEEIFKNIQDLADEIVPEERYVHVPHLKRFRAKSVYVSTLNRAIKYLQAKYPVDTKKWLEFLIAKIKTPHRVGDWYFHLIWLYMRHLKPINNEYAAVLLSEVLNNYRTHLTDRQLYSLYEKSEQLKLCKKNKIDESYHKIFRDLLPEPIDDESFPRTVIDARTIRSNDAGRKRSYVMQDEEGQKTYMNVENIALAHYIDSGRYTDGKHCEGSLIKALFTLYFWDLIYKPTKNVPATFLSKYQVVPLDMYTSHFYVHRKQAIDQRLKDIEEDWSDEALLIFARNHWLLHSNERGFYDVGIIESEEFLSLLVECTGRTLLSGIFKRLVKDVRQYSSGMPDLLIWNDKEKLVKFVEVKGENDRLSITQKLWIKYLISIGADVEVCHVHSTGSKRKYTNKTFERSTSEVSIISSEDSKPKTCS